MPNPLGAAHAVNHEGHTSEPVQDGDVHEAMARIADIIVENGEGLTLESLIKAFWRTYSTPEGNIVSIHEGRTAAPGPVVAEDAFARLSGRMDQIAQSLGFLSERVESREDIAARDVAQAARAYCEDMQIVPPVAQNDEIPARARDDGNGLPVRRRHDDGTSAEQADAPKFETGLPDRAQFELALEENYRIAQREIEPLSIAICSVSRIEQIVEQHGLHTAKRLMDRVASTLSLAAKGECYSARKGNSEFIMLARGITISQFAAVIEHSIADLAARRWHDKFSNQTLGMIEMHVGIAHVFDFATPSHAMRAADLAHEQAMLEHASNVVLADAKDLALG